MCMLKVTRNKVWVYISLRQGNYIGFWYFDFTVVSPYF